MSTHVHEDKLSFLHLLVDLATVGALQPRIVLFVNGATIVGTLISMNDWVDMFRDLVAARVPSLAPDMADAVDEALAHFHEPLTTADAPHTFVHLADVHVDSLVSPLLRFRFGQIDGWGFVDDVSRMLGQGRQRYRW